MSPPIRYNGTPDQMLPPNGPGWAHVTVDDDYARAVAPSMLGALPLWHFKDEQLPSGLYRFFAWEKANGAKSIAAIKLIGDSGGTLGAPNVGAVYGDAVVIDPATAENACTGTNGPSSDGFVSNANPPSDVEQVLGGAPGYGGYGPGYQTTYVMYKTGPAAELWRLSYPESFTKCSQLAPAKLPSNPSDPTTTTTSNTGLIVGLVVGAIALAGGTVAYVATR
jgi:hypothetical protein